MFVELTDNYKGFQVKKRENCVISIRMKNQQRKETNIFSLRDAFAPFKVDDLLMTQSKYLHYLPFVAQNWDHLTAFASLSK